MIQEIVWKHADYFQVQSITNEHLLDLCRSTSFTWTHQPKTLVLAANKNYFAQAYNNPDVLGIIATPQSIAISPFPDKESKAIITSGKAAELFYYLHNQQIHMQHITQNNNAMSCISPSASISATAVLGKNVMIADDVVIGHYCVVLDNTRIGCGSILHPFVTVGTEGFFSKIIMGKKTHIKHYGGVSIGENCIIHTGTNISRSVNFCEETVLSNNVHIGIHSNIGHDCFIGESTDISTRVVLAGRVQVGTNCWIGANATIANALKIGDGCSIKIGSVVIDNAAEQTELSGNFALDHRGNLKEYLKKRK
jgi:UDP-3-O-[3-hydroxymyristoyl] glucosamine N-acyltransferase